MNVRGSGILLHITSLPSPYGIGDFGPSAYNFVDMLHRAKQLYWQILPLTPIDPIYGNSPYNSNSAFAGNILLVSPEILIKEGLLEDRDVPLRPFSLDTCDYESVIVYKQELLNRAFESFKKQDKGKNLYDDFCCAQAWWLDDYALFKVIKSCLYNQVWSDWPKELLEREEKALAEIKDSYSHQIEREKFFQYLFYRQWHRLRDYCHQRHINIIGDMPIYVNYDSADVWANSQIFKLGEDKKPLYLAGVPPDYFSEKGQLWGNPVYDWERLKHTHYKWWIERLGHSLSLYDILRIDHFRGFVACWEVPYGEETAINGQWVQAPAEDFFTALYKRFFYLPIIAEDLGVITSDVRELMNRFGIPGMKVLLFAFSEDNPHHPYLPHNYIRNCVVYTGTHDTNTIRGWFDHEARGEDLLRLNNYLGREVTADTVHWELIRLAMQSVAHIAIIPMQDLLGLGQEARMNRPSVGRGNWTWRMLPHQPPEQTMERLLEMTQIYGRAL